MKNAWRPALCVMILMAASGAAPAGPTAPAPLVTPAEWLKAQPRPVFKEGHTLPPLARWGWAMSFDVAKELADHWGYAVEFAGYVSGKVADDALADPKSRNAQCLALVASDPKKYKLGVLVDRQFPKDMPPEAYIRDAGGHFIPDKWNPKSLSPEMPEDCLRQAGQLHAVGLAKLRTRCPITIIQNGGEYGLNVLGWVQKYWEKDPRVIAAKGDRSWYAYISRQKAREQKAVADAIRAAAPDRLLYVFYTCGGDTHRHGTLETFHDDWAWDFSEMRACADIATNEYYYHDFNSGWIGKDDMLTQALGAKGYELRFGIKNSYDYLCPGYRQDPKAPTPAVWDATQPIWSSWGACMRCSRTRRHSCARATCPEHQRLPIQVDAEEPAVDHDGDVLPDAGLEHVRRVPPLAADDQAQAQLRPSVQKEAVVHPGGELVEDASRLVLAGLNPDLERNGADEVLGLGRQRVAQIGVHPARHDSFAGDWLGAIARREVANRRGVQSAAEQGHAPDLAPEPVVTELVRACAERMRVQRNRRARRGGLRAAHDNVVLPGRRLDVPGEQLAAFHRAGNHAAARTWSLKSVSQSPGQAGRSRILLPASWTSMRWNAVAPEPK